MLFYKKVSIEDAIKPKNGRAITNRWWTITPEREILFYRNFAPQCNANEDIAKSMRDKLHPDCTVEFLELVFTGKS